jgi:putative tryptophan/tyrosine transport system substrate-binding protein
MLNRRTLLVTLGSSAFVVSNSFAQQHLRKPPRIGWLVPTTQAEWDGLLEEYRRGMRELGYVEGRTVETEYLYADGHFDRLPDLAAKLVEHKVDLIVTASTPAIIATKRITDKIPVVFAASSDPLSTGVVTSLAKPGGNITGLSLMASDLSAKRLELISHLRAQREQHRRSVGLLKSGNGFARPRDSRCR